MMDALINSQAPMTMSSSQQHLKAAEDDENIWTRILSEVSAKAINTLQGGTVIIVGDQSSGKSTLLSKLEKTDKIHPSSGLEYHVLNVQNDFRDSSYAYHLGAAGLGTSDNLILPVYTLSGEESFAPILQHALPSPSPSKAVVLLCVSIDNTNLIHSLRRWAATVAQQVAKKYEKSAIQEARNQLERYWQEYVEPSDVSMTTSIAAGIEEAGLLPLENGVLTENCGVNFIVVITKSDQGAALGESQLDRIQVQVRRFCLEIGAAMIVTSSETAKNIQLLYKYVVHRSFGLPFTSAAQVIERDALFVPAGWDGEKRIEIVKESVGDFDDALEPTREKPPVFREPAHEAEDEQLFLQKLLQLESTAPAPQPAKIVENEAIEASPLANFFSSLLKDKDKPSNTGGTSPRANSATAAAANAQPPQEDVQQQLDRIMKGVSNKEESGPDAEETIA